MPALPTAVAHQKKPCGFQEFAIRIEAKTLVVGMEQAI